MKNLYFWPNKLSGKGVVSALLQLGLFYHSRSVEVTDGRGFQESLEINSISCN